MNETGATLFGAKIGNLLLRGDGISAHWLSSRVVKVDSLTPLFTFFVFDFEGLLLISACTLDIANGRTSLEVGPLLAEFFILFIPEGL